MGRLKRPASILTEARIPETFIMDIVTQALLGANMAQTVAQKQHMRSAAVIGLFAGVLADIDVLIQSSSDPLLMLEYHRHFTHSVFFIPFGALVAALLAWPFARQRLRFGQIYLFALMGYMLSGFIDACTSYGTHLFWPLYPHALSFNIIAIIDPLFTLILLLTLLFALNNRRQLVVRTGLSLAALYLLFGWIQLQRATEVSSELAEQRQHPVQRMLLKPTLGNLLLWRSVYQSEGRLYVDAVRVGLFADNRIYPGASVALFDQQARYPSLPEGSVLYNDIRRFMAFSDHYVALLPGASSQQPEMLADVRYSMLPNSLQPLWGLQMDVQSPQQHADFRISRDTSKQTRQRFLSMLQGRDVVTP
jgi:inner membrane protein